VEEIESLGHQQKQELRNRLSILIGHLLKWKFQSELCGKSWTSTIIEQRDRITLRLSLGYGYGSSVGGGIGISFGIDLQTGVSIPLAYDPKFHNRTPK
jgi:hypothetical protein